MNKFDVIIIGAGVMGTSIAYHLCKKGASVALIDFGDIAGESSSHCDAVVGIASGCQNGEFGKIAIDSVKYTAQLGKEFSYDFEVDEKGAVYLFESEIERELGMDYVEQKHLEGKMDYRIIDNYELHQLEPYVANDLCGGYYCSGDIAKTISPYKLCFAFVEEAKRFGNIKVFTYTKVNGIIKDFKTNKIEAVDTNRGMLYGNKVVNAAGIGSKKIGEMVDIDIPVYARKGTILVSEKTKQICFHKVFEFGYIASVHPNVEYKRNIDENGEKYNVAFNMEYTMADNILLGGNRMFSDDPKSELEILRAISARGIRFYPALKDINCIRSYAGFRPFTIDLKPIMSDVDSIPGFYICTGHEGSGILTCATCGKEMAKMIMNEELDYDFEEMDYERFA